MERILLRNGIPEPMPRIEGTYLYQTLHVRGRRPLWLDRHTELLARNIQELFGLRWAPDLRRLEAEIAALLDANRHPVAGSSFVRMAFTPAGDLLLIPGAVSFYDGYALRSLRPAAAVVNYGVPYPEYPTSAREAACMLACKTARSSPSDVETPAGWVEPLVETLDRDRTVAAVAPKLLSLVEPARFEYAGASGGFIDYLGYPFCRGRILQCVERDEGQYDDARDVFWASGAAFCCRAEVFRAMGGFDEDFFAHMEEIDLCWRMQLAGYRVRIEPRSRVYHLGGGSLAQGSPSKVFYNHRNNLAMLYKCASPVQRSVVAIVRPVLDSCAALSYLMQGRPDYVRAVGRAWRDFLRAHKALAAKRRAVRGAAKGKPRGIYCGSIVLRYLLGRRRFGKLL